MPARREGGGEAPGHSLALPTLGPPAGKLTGLGLNYPASCPPEPVEDASCGALSAVGPLDLVLTRQLEREDEWRVQSLLKGGRRARRSRTPIGLSRSAPPPIEVLYIPEKASILFLGPYRFRT